MSSIRFVVQSPTGDKIELSQNEFDLLLSSLKFNVDQSKDQDHNKVLQAKDLLERLSNY